MKIDWFTVIAQVINFLILAWLLKRFLYKPILKAIDEREKKIAGQLEDAEKQKTEAGKEQDDFRQKNKQFDQKKKELMDKAVTDANAERDKLLEAARNDANKLSAKLEEASKTQQENMNRAIAQKTEQEVFAITRKTLADLASISLEEQSVNVFIKRLNELKEGEKKKFIEAFKSASNLPAGREGSIFVRSAFDLPPKQQDEIKKSVSEILDAETKFQFKVTPELISGIELTANGFKLAWSISGYLGSLQKSISEIKERKLKEEPEKTMDLARKSEPENRKDVDKKVEADPKIELDKK